MSPLVAALVGALVGAAPVLALRGWLARAAFRYEDEADLPRGSTWWVLPVALSTGVALGWAWAARPALAVVYAACAGPLAILTFIDLDVHRLPDRWTKPAWVVVPAVLLGVAVIEGLGFAGWVWALVCGGILGLTFLVLALVGGGSGMGLGDVKLAPSLGMLLGFAGVGQVITWVIVTFLAGGLAAIVLLLRGRHRSSHFAFGPFMAFGTVVALAMPTLLPDLIGVAIGV